MPAGSYAFHIGSFRCSVLSDGYCAYPADWFFPNADPVQLAAALDRRRLPHDTVLSPHTCLLIETGRHVVLVDTGTGAGEQSGGALVARLDVAGIRPGDVDTVVLTHAHADHIGGTVSSSRRPIFSSARHVLSEYEYEFWKSGRPDLSGMRVPPETRAGIAAVAKRSLEALRFQIETVYRECEIVPGVHVLPTPGHTPGHLAVMVDSNGERLLHIGDAAVHPLHLELPELPNGFDHAPDAASRTRRELLDRAASEQMRLLAYHFPFPSVGRISPGLDRGWDWSPEG